MNILVSAIRYCYSHLGTLECIYIEQKLIYMLISITIQKHTKKLRYYLIIDLTRPNSKLNCFTDFRAWGLICKEDRIYHFIV